MQSTVKNLYRIGIVAAVAAFTTVACDNSDYRSSNSTTVPDSAVATNPAASSTPAGQAATPSTPASTDMDSTMSKSTAAASSSRNNPETKSAIRRKRATTAIVMTDKVAGGTMPEFPGGQKALDNYVNDHINFPQDAVDNDAEGTVRVSFVVDENGKVTKAKLMNAQKVGSGLDQEALRVVNTMPEWKPGTIHGKRVKTRLELPISFQVES